MKKNINPQRLKFNGAKSCHEKSLKIPDFIKLLVKAFYRYHLHSNFRYIFKTKLTLKFYLFLSIAIAFPAYCIAQQAITAHKDTLGISVGVELSNSLTGTHNLSLSSGLTNKLVYNPFIAYDLYYGFSITLMPYITNVSKNGTNKLQDYQTGLGLSYDHTGDHMIYSASYFYNFTDKKMYNSYSFYQNDINASAILNSKIIRPGVQIGYSSGKYYQSETVPLRTNMQGVTIYGIDSTLNKDSYFSIAPQLDHVFHFPGFLSQEGTLKVTPSLILNAAIDNDDIAHNNVSFSHRKKMINKKFQSQSSGFNIQATAAYLDMEYTIKRWSIEPSYYESYYFKANSHSHFSGISDVRIEYDF